MKLAIVIATFALVSIIATLFLIRLRRLERAGGTLHASNAQRQMISFIPGAIIGSTLWNWFYYETGIKNTLLTSASVSRQIADIISITAFILAGLAAVEIIKRGMNRFERSKKDSNTAEQGAAANP